MQGLPSILSVFPNKFNKFNNTGAWMLHSIYQITIKLVKTHFLTWKHHDYVIFFARSCLGRYQPCGLGYHGLLTQSLAHQGPLLQTQTCQPSKIRIYCLRHNEISPTYTIPQKFNFLYLLQNCNYYMGLDARKPVFGGLQTTRAQTSLPICADWSAPLLFGKYNKI